MIEPLYRYTSIGTVEQKRTTNATGGIDLDVVAGLQTVITNVPSIFGKSITVFVNTTVKLNHVYVRKYAGSRTMFVDVDVTGVVGAGATVSADLVGQIGESYDIVVDASGGGSIKLWTCVRQA